MKAEQKCTLPKHERQKKGKEDEKRMMEEEIGTRWNRSEDWLAIALPLTIMLLSGVLRPRAEVVEGKTEIPPVFRPMSWLNSTKSLSFVPISSNDWL